MESFVGIKELDQIATFHGFEPHLSKDEEDHCVGRTDACNPIEESKEVKV